jgi:ankyrin repeat protein
LLHREYFEYLKRQNESSYEEFNHYYISRQLKRCTKIDSRIFDDKKLTIVQTEEEFNKKCSQKNPQIKNVHFLLQDKENKNLFVWQKSNGPISDLSEFILKREESIEQEKILKHGENIVIISAEPGMGKSTILDTFGHEELFFLKIVLNNFSGILSQLKENKIKLEQEDHDPIDFTLKRLLGKKEQLELKLLKHLAQERKLILMFDGVDEVIDYKDQVKGLIKAIQDKYEFMKIFVTTRSHLKAELENYFRTIAFDLNVFEEGDQIEFLCKYWRRCLELKGENEIGEAELKQFAQDLVVKMRKSLTPQISGLIGIPLQTKMLADVFLEEFYSRTEGRDEEEAPRVEIVNIAVLYHQFVETKVKIRFREKRQIKGNEDLYDSERRKFYSDFTKLSFKLLFNKSAKSLEEDLNDEKRIQEIIKYGVIIAFTANNKTPKFLHQSFAEFFLAKSCLQKIKDQKRIKDDKELKQILREERHFLIRKFLNDLMGNYENQQEPQKKKRKYEKEDFNKEIENCCRENLLSLLKYFIDDQGAQLKTRNEFLITATRNDHKEIVAFLLEKGIDINQTSNGGQTALMLASERGHEEIVKMLLEKDNIDINQTDKYGKTALMWASLKGHVEIVKMLLEKENIDINQTNKGGWTALMLATEQGHSKIVKMLLEKDNIDINQTTKYGSTALMLASMFGHKEIVKMLEAKVKEINLKMNKLEDITTNG